MDNLLRKEKKNLIKICVPGLKMLGCLLTTQQTQEQRVGLQISSGLSAIHLLSPVESSQLCGDET